jgi:hypothetical protein
MPKADVATGSVTTTVCPRCRTHRLFRVPLSASSQYGLKGAGGRAAQLMCADQVHCLYTDTEVSDA